jgi:hypothetical protein
MKPNKKSNKESTATLFNRYIWLVDTIFSAGRITFEEINEKWKRSRLNFKGDDIPLRTFHNHRLAIEEMFDINIECDKREGYVYYIENKDDMRRGGMRSWMLNALSVGNLLSEISEIKDRILFEKIPSGHQYLTTFLEAIRDNLSVEITYQSFEKDVPSTFPVEPYCLKVFRQRWYLLARNPRYDELRIYSLDRVHQVEVTNTPFVYPADFSPENYFHHSFGIIHSDGEEPETVEIKVYGNQRRYFETLPLHHSQTLVDDQADYAVFQYLLHPTYDFLQELLSHGENAEVLKPIWLRQEVADVVQQMSEMYKI